MRLSALLLGAAVAFALPKERLDGHKVVTANIDTQQKLDALKSAHPDWDIWSNDCVLFVGEGNDIHLPADGEHELQRFNISYKTMIPDLQAAVEATYARSNATQDWFAAYHTYDEIHQWYSTAARTYASIASWQTVGSSVQGRSLGLFTIDTKKGATKKAYIQAGIHAREWISPAVTNYIVNELLTKYGSDSAITDLLDKVILYVVPVVNPDGYSFTWTNTRLWRKNRRQNSASSFGVDLNRNYGSHWGCCGGSSGDPNSDTYRGPAAFSEPESDALSRVVLSLKPNGAIDMHSYSQLILRAWGWTRTNTPDETALAGLGNQIRLSIAKPYGTAFTNQKSIDLYVTDGTASDWFYDPVDGANSKWSYTIELRDTGRYGFVLPPDQITPSGIETFLGIQDWLAYIRDN
eukprot:TRINITY_DN7493_c0_g1_i1.p1 TRINITY_DN7493_c0_g1~~TRINITY_DN7493_c0_g1_i1.p1  ORF type:complete len:419 (-),score=88.92 TRINITY_DN7493_c0_g1_i1:59-1279(-)